MDQVKEFLSKTVAGVPYWAIAAAGVVVAYMGGFIGKKKRFKL